MEPIDRRDVLKYTGVLAATPLVYGTDTEARPREGGGGIADDYFEPESEFFATSSVEDHASVETRQASRGDLWPSCWADDGNLYTANGDGRGFGPPKYSNIAMNRVQGTPETGFSGERLARNEEIAPVWGDSSEYRQKPTGMVAIDSDDDGQDELYVAVQDLRAPVGTAPAFDDAPRAGIAKSEDYGETWEATDGPMFTDYRFTTMFFLDYGQSSEHAQVLGSEDSQYVYVYGIDWNWRDCDSNIVPDPTKLYLARVPKGSIQNRSQWEFYAGTRSRGASKGEPTWESEIDRREPVLQDERRVYRDRVCDSRSAIADDGKSVISQGSVVYNEPLDRYIYTSWTWYTFEFYEAPQPWGPWNLFMRRDFGASPWFGSPSGNDCPGPNEGGYATTIPSKFISDDGKSMWVQSDSNGLGSRWGYECGRPNYNFSLRTLDVEPYTETDPSNDPDPTRNLARSEDGTTPIAKCAHHGYKERLNDGSRSEDESSWDCEDKPLDFWGYTWDREYNLDRVVYTTGSMFSDGGWFEDDKGGLTVQVRQDFEWVDVDGLSISPDYPYDDSAGPNETYTLSFDDTWGDGVRIIAPPGGSRRFTTVSELEVYYESDDRPGRGPPEDTPGRGPPDDGDTPGRGPPEEPPGHRNKPPATVTGLQADGGVSEVTLSWDPVDSEIARYEVYASREPGVEIDDDTLVGATDVPSFTHDGKDEYAAQGLWGGVTWYYRVRAVDNDGNVGSASEEASATTDPTTRIEGESLYPPTDTTDRQNVVYRKTVQFSADEWSDDAQLVFVPGGADEYVTGTFTVSETGTYELSAAFTKSFDYGIHELSIDGESTGQTFDGYNAPPNALTRADPVSYGQFDLDAGEHTLTLTVTGKNSQSNGYRAGFDFFELQPVDGGQ